MVTWCSVSGESDQKSHIAVGERRLVFGCALLGVDEVGELSASRTKKTGVLLPTMSQLPSSV